jgi:hypothetical protein
VGWNTRVSSRIEGETAKTARMLSSQTARRTWQSATKSVLMK